MDFKRMFDFSNMDDKTKGMIKMAFILIGIFVAFILFFVIYNNNQTRMKRVMCFYQLFDEMIRQLLVLFIMIPLFFLCWRNFAISMAN